MFVYGLVSRFFYPTIVTGKHIYNLLHWNSAEKDWKPTNKVKLDLLYGDLITDIQPTPIISG